MRPSERIPLILRCARALATGRNWSEVDFILGQFQLPTSDQWDGPHDDAMYHYALAMLGDRWVTDEQLEELDEYLNGAAPPVDLDEAPWSTSSPFRLFISHVAQEKAFATQLKHALSRYGLESFVAHEDIEPGEPWQRTILAALHSCDALVALLHNGFTESRWCDQEVGIAIGRGVPTIPVRLDFDPYGFLGSVQAITSDASEYKALAKGVLEALFRDKRTADGATGAAVLALVHSTSFNQSNSLAAFLQEHPDRITWDHVDRLRQAQKANYEVEAAWAVGACLDFLEARLPQRPAQVTSTYEDDEPF